MKPVRRKALYYYIVLLLSIVTTANLSGQTVHSALKDIPLFSGFSLKDFVIPELKISVDPPGLRSEEGSKIILSVISKSKWNLRCSEAWMSADILSGTNSMKVTITAQENTELYARSGEITVAAEGDPPRIIEIIQKAGHEE